MRALLVMIGVFAFCLTPCRAGGPENVAAARAMVEAINARQLDRLERWVAPQVVRHSGATPDVAVRSLEDFKAFLAADFLAVPDSVMSVKNAFGTDSWVALQGSYAGTQRGPMGPFPASGRRFELSYLAMLRFEEERIVEIWVEWDNLGVLSQLGHLAPPPD